MADQPDEFMDLTDLPLPSGSKVLTEAQDAASSTSATPFAELPTIAAPTSKAQKQREYRQRIAGQKTPAQAIAARKSDTERQRNCRLRKAANSTLVSGSLESTTASSSRSEARSNDVQTGTQQELTHQQRQTSAAEPAQITVQPGTSSDQIEVQQAQSTWKNIFANIDGFLGLDEDGLNSTSDQKFVEIKTEPLMDFQEEENVGISDAFVKNEDADKALICAAEAEVQLRADERKITFVPHSVSVNNTTSNTSCSGNDVAGLMKQIADAVSNIRAERMDDSDRKITAFTNYLKEELKRLPENECDDLMDDVMNQVLSVKKRLRNSVASTTVSSESFSPHCVTVYSTENVPPDAACDLIMDEKNADMSLDDTCNSSDSH